MPILKTILGAARRMVGVPGIPAAGVLKRITGIVKRALGVPHLVNIGVKRKTAQLLTFGLKRMGLDTAAIEAQIVQVFDEKSAPDVIKVIEAASERMDLIEQIGAMGADTAFPRRLMFETSFRSDRKYRYFMHVTIYNKNIDQTYSKWVSFYANENMTKADLAAFYEQDMLIEYHKAQYSLEAYNVFEVWHNDGMTY